MSADAGPLPLFTLYALRDQHTPSGPEGPRQNRPPPVPLAARGDLRRKGENRGPAHMGPAVLGKSTPLGSANSSAFPNGPRAGRAPTRERSAPLPSLALGSGPAAAKPVFMKSDLENLPGVRRGQEARETRADRDNCVAAALMAARVSCC